MESCGKNLAGLDVYPNARDICVRDNSGSNILLISNPCRISFTEHEIEIIGNRVYVFMKRNIMLCSFNPL